MKGFISHLKLLASFEKQCKKAKRPGFFLRQIKIQILASPLPTFHICTKLFNLCSPHCLTCKYLCPMFDMRSGRLNYDSV